MTLKVRLQTLQKRQAWLEARVALAREQGQTLSYDEREAASLRWAVSVIKKAHPELRGVEYDG